MNDDKKADKNGEVETVKDKKKDSSPMTVSYVTALIISFLGFVAIIYDVFSINLGFMNPIMELINDANGFLTFICVSFIAYELTQSTLKTKAIVAHFIGIVMVNRLYSNLTWLTIFDFLKKLDGRYIAFAIAITVAILYLCLKIRKDGIINNEKATSTTPPLKEPNNRTEKEQNQNFDPRSQNNTGRGNKPLSPQKVAVKNLSFISVSISVLFAVVAFFFLDDYFVNKSSIEIVRPSFFLEVINYGYIGFVVLPALLVLLGMLFFFGKKKRNRQSRSSSDVVAPTNEKGKSTQGVNREDNNNEVDPQKEKKLENDSDGDVVTSDEGMFHITAVIAIILEVALFTMANKSELLNLNDKFVAYITDDVFSFIIYGSLLFLLLQLGLVVFIGLFTHYGLGNSITKKLRKYIQNIQKRIIDIACGLLIGCLSLFRFIPDFFDTIGVLLLGKDPEEEDKDK